MQTRAMAMSIRNKRAIALLLASVQGSGFRFQASLLLPAIPSFELRRLWLGPGRCHQRRWFQLGRGWDSDELIFADFDISRLWLLGDANAIDEYATGG